MAKRAAPATPAITSSKYGGLKAVIPSPPTSYGAIFRLSSLFVAFWMVSVMSARWLGTTIASHSILYQSPAAFGHDLKLLDTRLSVLANFTRDIGDESFPAWSPDGSQLVYFSLQDNQYRLQARDIAGSPLGSLLLVRGGLGYPAWSPDGRSIAYSEERDGHAAIYLIDVTCLIYQADCIPEKLTDYRAELLQWSPDGSQMVFMSNCENNCDLYLLNLSSHSVVQLTNNGLYDAFPSWSPDGKRIVFMSSRRTSFELYLLDLTCASAPGTCEDNLQRLTDNRDFDGFPLWSPDGRRILYSSQRDGDFNLYELDTACLNEQPTSCEQTARALTSSPASDISPAWSPDGRWIAFVSDNRLAVMPAGGGPIRYLVDGVQPNQALLWQPTMP